MRKRIEDVLRIGRDAVGSCDELGEQSHHGGRIRVGGLGVGNLSAACGGFGA